MAKLTIQRKGGLLGFATAYRILIDGKEAGTIKQKQTKEFVLSNESHSFRVVAGRLTGTDEIQFDSTTQKIFQVSINPIMTLSTAYALIIISIKTFTDNSSIFHFQFSKVQFWILFAPAILISLYFLTLGRKNYLQIKESSELNLSLL